MHTLARTRPINTDQLPTRANAFSQAVSILELHSISCAYDSSRPAVRDMSFSVREGEILCLLGPSGCGKTTVLRAIAGFEPVQSGEILLSGRVVSSLSETVPTEHRRIGMVFQEYALFPHLRVADNIAFGLNHLPRAERKRLVDEMLCLTGLEGFERRYPMSYREGSSNAWRSHGRWYKIRCYSYWMNRSATSTPTWLVACAKRSTLCYAE